MSDAALLSAFESEATFLRDTYRLPSDTSVADALRQSWVASQARSWAATYLEGFAGAWIEFNPTVVFIGIAGSRSKAQAFVDGHFDAPGLRVPTVVSMPRSRADLADSVSKLKKAIGPDGTGVRTFVAIDEKSGNLKIYGRPLSTKQRPDVDQLLKDPKFPSVDWVGGQVDPPANVYGGFDARTQIGCTMAFAVASPAGQQGLLTAGHCSDGPVGALASAVYERSWWSPGTPDGPVHAWDRQLHLASPSDVAVPTLSAPAINIRGSFLPAPGGTICRYGAKSVSLGQSTTFCRAVTGYDSDGLVMMNTSCLFGDSGGPSWAYGRAVGIAAATTNGNSIDSAGICFEAPIKDQLSGTPFFVKDWSPSSSSSSNYQNMGLYHAITPNRVLDTRGLGYSSVRSANLGGALPFSDLGSAVLSVTVVAAPGSAGYATVYAGDTGFIPDTSNINFSSNAESNLVVVRADRISSTVRVYTSNYSDVIVDVVGYFSDTSGTAGAASGLRVKPIAGARAYDSRSGSPLGPGASRDVGVVGFAVPTTASAVVVNVTVTGPSGSGYLTIHKGGSAVPSSSNINFGANETKARLAIAEVDSLGRIRVSNGPGATTHFLVDVVGYMYAPSSTEKLGRSFALEGGGGRIYDSRSSGAVPGGSTRCLLDVYSFRNQATNGIPRERVSGVWMNITTTGASSGGFMSVFPSGSSTTASNINYATGTTTANAVFVPLQSASLGVICFSTSAGASAHFIFDVMAYTSSD